MGVVWLPIRYREFYDFPRAFVVQLPGSMYYFDCPFDNQVDEYPDHYRVYRLAPDVPVPPDGESWEGLEQHGQFVREIPTQGVRFDGTKRVSVDAKILENL
jgi:hypothetical protein